MKLKELKRVLDRLTPEQLEQDLVYMSDQYSISGVANKFLKARKNLYYTGEDDSSQLYTYTELKDDFCYSKEEIENCEIDIHKNNYVLHLD